MDKIDRIFIDVVKTEGNFFLELEEKYLADKLEINHRGLTIAEIETLRERPLEVGYISDYEPISFTNEDGEPDGAMVETLSVLAERYDFQVNYHPYSILDDPNDHEGFDLLVTLYGEGAHEFEHYQPTEAYYLISVYAQVKASVHSSSGSTKETIEASPRIGSLRYQSVEYEVFLDEFPDNEFVFYDDWHQLLDDFADGTVDMMISTDSAARYAELYLEDVDRETISTDLQIPMQYFISHEIADEYIPIFNVMLDRQTEDEYEAVLITNANAYYPENKMDFLEFMQDRWYMFLGTALVIVATFLGFALYAQKKKKDALKEAYDTDALTDFLAMHRFREIVKEKLSEAKENEYELISFDIDMFKTINTHFSAERGTNVIKAIANSLKTVFEGKTAVICRKTADQFLVFRRVDDGGTLRQIYSSDILPSIQGVMGEKYNVMMSFGNVVIRDCKANPSTIIGQADNARVQGKNEHKTTFITFDEKMQKFYEERVNVTFRMEQALKNREFTVVYQPKIDFKTLEVGGAEALVRWFPKLGNTIFPDQFIPVFEANGFIEFLDLYVLEDVCKFIRSNYRTMSIPRISVNLSANTILADNIVARVTDIVSTYSIRPDEIELEITESAVEGDTEKFMLRVKQLREMGYPIAIDDFGAGVSSLNRLSAIEADVLKLDKAFFDLKDQGGKSAVVVTNVIAMAKELKMKVVAEGVETYAQALWLRKIDCDYAQGYYFERPISENDFKALLESKKVFSIEL